MKLTSVTRPYPSLNKLPVLIPQGMKTEWFEILFRLLFDQFHFSIIKKWARPFRLCLTVPKLCPSMPKSYKHFQTNPLIHHIRSISSSMSSSIISSSSLLKSKPVLSSTSSTLTINPGSSFFDIALWGTIKAIASIDTESKTTL